MIAEELGIHSVQNILERTFQLEGKTTGKEYIITCPNPLHDDHNPSCSVNLSTGLWNCFACSMSGDIIKLGQLALGKEREEILDIITPGTMESLMSMLESKLRTAIPGRQEKSIDIPPLSSYSTNYSFQDLKNRGFTNHTISKWDLRYAPLQRISRGLSQRDLVLQNYIVIPVMDEQRNILFYCYRATSQSTKWQQENCKYAYTANAPLRSTLFGLQHYGNVKHIVLTEGPLDALWCDQANVPALAILGTRLSGERSSVKLRRLLDYESVTLLLDYDTAGAMAVVHIGSLLEGKVPVKIALWRRSYYATDPQEMSPVDVEIAVASAMPWTEWKLTKNPKSIIPRREIGGYRYGRRPLPKEF
jgi:DNA primase